MGYLPHINVWPPE